MNYYDIHNFTGVVVTKFDMFDAGFAWTTSAQFIIELNLVLLDTLTLVSQIYLKDQVWLKGR